MDCVGLVEFTDGQFLQYKIARAQPPFSMILQMTRKLLYLEMENILLSQRQRACIFHYMSVSTVKSYVGERFVFAVSLTCWFFPSDKIHEDEFMWINENKVTMDLFSLAVCGGTTL